MNRDSNVLLCFYFLDLNLNRYFDLRSYFTFTHGAYCDCKYCFHIFVFVVVDIGGGAVFSMSLQVNLSLFSENHVWSFVKDQISSVLFSSESYGGGAILACDSSIGSQDSSWTIISKIFTMKFFFLFFL